EAIEAIEAFLEWPFTLRSSRAEVLGGHVVILAEPERAVPVVLEDLSDRRALGGQSAGRAGKTVGCLGDGGATIHMMIAPGEERRARRRAERRGVPLRIAEPAFREFLERRHVDTTAKRRPRGHAAIVIENDEDVRRTFRGCWKRVWRPVGL